MTGKALEGRQRDLCAALDTLLAMEVLSDDRRAEESEGGGGMGFQDIDGCGSGPEAAEQTEGR